MIKWLTRLPPNEKVKVVVGQLLPMGEELHSTRWEEGATLVGEMAGWVIDAYKG